MNRLFTGSIFFFLKKTSQLPFFSTKNQGFFTNGNHNLYRGYRSYRCGAVIKTANTDTAKPAIAVYRTVFAVYRSGFFEFGYRFASSSKHPAKNYLLLPDK
jgi:hypothetical protein